MVSVSRIEIFHVRDSRHFKAVKFYAFFSTMFLQETIRTVPSQSIDLIVHERRLDSDANQGKRTPFVVDARLASRAGGIRHKMSR